MRITSTTSAEKVQHDGVIYEADDEGVFEVPEPVGLELVGFPGWLPEYEAKAIAAEQQRARDTDAAQQAERIADLTARVEALEAALADGDDDPAVKPKRGRKPAAPTE